MALKFQMVRRPNPAQKGEKLWYGTVRHEEPTITLAKLAEHMAEHNTPYSKGLIQGILTDMVGCIKEKALEGFKIKIDDLAIFMLKTRSTGEEDPKNWSVQKNVVNVHLSAYATGNLSIANLREAVLVESPDYKSPRHDDAEGI